ncbi:MAG TPA: hypothetical protein VHG91_13700, partial [Longimicrobium sp.]|nr:hypothetical protein [Longimicrobium sp.]
APAPPAAEADAPAGVSIGLDRGEVRVVFTDAAEGLVVRTRLVDGRLAEVTASGAAAKARFRTSPGTIEVAGAGAGEVTVGLPRGARTATVEVDGRVVAAKEGASLRSSGGEPVFRVGS